MLSSLVSNSSRNRSAAVRALSTASRREWTPADIQLRTGQCVASNNNEEKQAAEHQFRQMLNQNEEFRTDLAYALSYSTPFSEFEQTYLNNKTNQHNYMNEQLEMSTNQLKTTTKHLSYKRKTAAATTASSSTVHSTTSLNVKTDSDPLPRTLAEAMRNAKHKHRAIVVTEATAPFRIVAVNDAWVKMCGYTSREARGQTLGSLLHGPDTNSMAATSLIAQLLQGGEGPSEIGTTLINYTKDKRRFRNRIRVGTIVDVEDEVQTAEQKQALKQYFVGVLQEVSEESSSSNRITL